MKATPLVKWLRLDDRKYRGSKNAPDPWRPPPRRGTFLGRDEANMRVVVAEEDGCCTFGFPKGRAVGERLLYEIQHAPQDALRFLLGRPGTYTASELVKVLDACRRR